MPLHVLERFFGRTSNRLVAILNEPLKNRLLAYVIGLAKDGCKSLPPWIRPSPHGGHHLIEQAWITIKQRANVIAANVSPVIKIVGERAEDLYEMMERHAKGDVTDQSTAKR
ncbi:MAG: hypothetical protein AAF797_12320 [Planctomycetota bacterium]